MHSTLLTVVDAQSLTIAIVFRGTKVWCDLSNSEFFVGLGGRPYVGRRDIHL